MSHVSLESLGIKDSVDNRISSVAVMQIAMVCGGMLCINTQWLEGCYTHK